MDVGPKYLLPAYPVREIKGLVYSQVETATFRVPRDWLSHSREARGLTGLFTQTVLPVGSQMSRRRGSSSGGAGASRKARVRRFPPQPRRPSFSSVLSPCLPGETCVQRGSLLCFSHKCFIRKGVLLTSGSPGRSSGFRTRIWTAVRPDLVGHLGGAVALTPRRPRAARPVPQAWALGGCRPLRGQLSIGTWAGELGCGPSS